MSSDLGSRVQEYVRLRGLRLLCLVILPQARRMIFFSRLDARLPFRVL